MPEHEAGTQKLVFVVVMAKARQSRYGVDETTLEGTAVRMRRYNPMQQRNLNQFTKAKRVPEIQRVPAAVRCKAAALLCNRKAHISIDKVFGSSARAWMLEYDSSNSAKCKNTTAMLKWPS